MDLNQAKNPPRSSTQKRRTRSALEGLPLAIGTVLTLVCLPLQASAAAPATSALRVATARQGEPRGEPSRLGVDARFDANFGAIVILSVEAGSLAAKSGLQKGDVVARGIDESGREIDFERGREDAFGTLVRQSKFTLFVYREGVAEDEPMRIVVQRGKAHQERPVNAERGERGNGNTKHGGRAVSTAPTLVLEKRAFTDPEFGGIESHHMLVPKTWQAQVQPRWKVDDGNFLDVIGRVASPEGHEIVFDMARTLTFSEDPQYLQFMKQNHPAEVPSHIRPPQRIGEYATLALTPALRPNARNVQLVSSKREVELEKAAKKMLEPMIAMLKQNGPEPFISFESATVRYDENGQSFDEMSTTLVMIIAIPSLAGPPILRWNMIGTRCFRAPTGRLDGELAQLVSIANTLRPTPRWSICSAQLQQELSAIRHKGNMDRLRIIGENSRRIAQTNSEISDMQMASWRRQQAESDAGHRAFVNGIHEVHDYKSRDGFSLSLSHNYDRVFQDALGNVILTNDTSYDPTADTNLKTNDWKPLERIGR